jgi:TRAP-type transport system small permease protein
MAQQHTKRWYVSLERAVEAFLHHASAATLFALMTVTCVDVIGRYFFNRPVYGGLELTEILLACMIFSALPIVCRHGEHISVDLIALRPRWARAAQHVVVNLLGMVIAGFLAHQLWLRAAQLGRAGETTMQIRIPMQYVAWFISALMAVAVLAFLARALRPHEADEPSVSIETAHD